MPPLQFVGNMSANNHKTKETRRVNLLVISKLTLLSRARGRNRIIEIE